MVIQTYLGNKNFSLQLTFKNKDMEQKLDELLASITALKKDQDDNQKAMSDKLERLERDVQAGQEVAAEKIVKKLKRDRGYEFKKKGHERQYLFNDDIKDKMDSAASLSKVMPVNPKDKEALDNAAKELKEGVDAVTLRQKLICLADCSEFGWEAVDEYETDELTANEDDAKRLEKAEKAAEQKVLKKRKAAYFRGGGRGKGRRFNSAPMSQLPPQPSSSGSLMQPPGSVGTQLRGATYEFRVPGPCFNCLEMAT